jgi:hypothetical protein
VYLTLVELISMSLAIWIKLGKSTISSFPGARYSRFYRTTFSTSSLARKDSLLVALRFTVYGLMMISGLSLIIPDT